MAVMSVSRAKTIKKLLKLRKKCKIDSVLAANCKFILDKLMKHHHSYPFTHLVGFRHSDYLHIIKYPMDLSTVRKRLYTHHYSDAAEFESDVRHTFHNAMIYHPPHDQVHHYAKELMALFDDLWKSIIVKDTTVASNNIETTERCLDIKNNSVTLTKKRVPRLSNKKLSGVNSKRVSGEHVADSAMQQQKRVSEERSAMSEVCDQCTSVSSQYEEGEIHEHSSSKVLPVSKLKRKLSDIVANNDRVSKCKQKKANEGEGDLEVDVKLKRQKDREAARMALEKMEKSVDIQDNFQVMREMEALVGYPVDYEPLWVGVDQILKRVSHDYVPIQKLKNECKSQPSTSETDSQQHAEVEASEPKGSRVAKLMSRFGGIILKSQQTCMSQSQLGGGKTTNQDEVSKFEMEKAKEMEELEVEVKRCRQKDREAARMALEKVEQSVYVEDNFRVMREMETLFGYPVAFAPLWRNQLSLFLE